MTVESRLADVEDRQKNLRNADRLQNRRVSAAAPSDLNFLAWNATTKKWEPKAGVLNADLDTADVESSTAEETLYTHTIPADTLGATGGFKLTVGGDALKNAAGTLVLKVKLGATTVLETAAMTLDSDANRYKWFVQLVCMNSTTSAQKWTGEFHAAFATTSFAAFRSDQTRGTHAAGYGTSSEDTTTNLALTVTAQWSANSASLSFRKEIAVLERIGLSAGTGSGGVAAHNILDGGTGHSDSLADTPGLGSLIVGTAASKWDELVTSGNDGWVLTEQADGSAAWEAAGGGGQDLATDTLWAAEGDLVKGTGNDTADILTIGADHTVLVSNGSVPSYSAAPPLAAIADTGDTTRITLSTSSPEVTLTGDVVLDGHVAIDESLAAAVTLFVGRPGLTITGDNSYIKFPGTGMTLNANTTIVQGLLATPSFTFAAATSAHQIRGLYFTPQVSGSGDGAEVSGIFTNINVVSFTGTLDEWHGLYVGTRIIVLGSPTITAMHGVRIKNQGHVSVGTTYGIKVEDQTGGTTAYGIYIEDADDYALFVDAGLSRFDGDGTVVFELPADATDPTSGGGAAAGRIPVKIGGATKYLAYY